MEERIRELEKRLAKVEEALRLLAEIAEPLVQAHAEAKAAAGQKGRWFRQEPIAKGRWLHLFAVGFKRPKP